jgi:hypothetical protein
MLITNTRTNIPNLVKDLQKRLKKEDRSYTQEKIATQLYPTLADPKDQYIKRFIRRTKTARYRPEEIVNFIKIFSIVMEPMEAIFLIVWSQIDSEAVEQIRHLFDSDDFENALLSYNKKESPNSISTNESKSQDHPIPQYVPLHRLTPSCEQIELGSIVGIESIVDDVISVVSSYDGSRFISIEGQGGIGKTTVAYVVVAKLRQTPRFKAILWITNGNYFSLASGNISQTQYASTLEQVGQILNIDDNSKIVSILHTEPYLVVVDNIETEEDAQLALSGLDKLAQGNTRFIITSRRSLNPEYFYIRSIKLLPLKEERACHLLQQLLFRMGHTLSDHKALEIVNVVGRIPLAIHIIVGLARIEPLDEIVQEIRYYQRDVNDRLKKIDIMFKHMYGRIWLSLGDEVRDFLVCIALQTPVDGIPREWAGAACGISETQLSDFLSETLDYSLITVNGLDEKTIIMHPLTIAYIRSQDIQDVGE